MMSVRRIIPQPLLIAATTAAMPELPPLPTHIQAQAASPLDRAALEVLHRDLCELLWHRRNKYYTWWGDFTAKLRRRQVVRENHGHEQARRTVATTSPGANGRNVGFRVAYPALDQLLPEEERVLDRVRGIILLADPLLNTEKQSKRVVEFTLSGLKKLELAMEGVEIFEQKKEWGL